MEPLSDPVQEQAAQLLAEGRYEIGEISEKTGVSRITLWRWRKDAGFTARVDELSRDFAEAALKRGLARKEYRVNVLANRHSKLQTVIEERAADPMLANVPGGKTGLVVQKTVVSSGEVVGYEYEVDTATMREMRAIEEQAAKELGQLVDKREHTVRGLRDLTDEELEAIVGDLSEPEPPADGGDAGAGEPEETPGEG